MVNRRNREVAPAIPFLFLYGTNGLTLTATPTPMQWSHAHYITSDFHYKEDGTRVTLNRTSGGALYKLYAQAGAEKTGGAPDFLTLQLYVNGVASPCCISHGAIGATGIHGDVTLVTAFYANVGDYIEVYVSVDAGTADIEVSTARLIIEGLPMKGWDNSSGGRTNFRGGVER